MDRFLRCQTALTRLCGCELAAMKLSDFVVQLNLSLLILSFPTVTQSFQVFGVFQLAVAICDFCLAISTAPLYFVARMLSGVNRGERHSLIGN